MQQGCPIYGKIRFLRIFIARFLRKKKIFGRIYGFFLTRFGQYPPPLPIALSRSRYSTDGRIYGFVRTESGYYYPTLDSPLWAAVFTFNPYLLISINELLISIIHLLISINELLISIIHLLISIKMGADAIFIDINK